MRIKATKQTENVYNQSEDRKPPKLAVQVKRVEKDKYLIEIIHPNRNADLKYDKLYSSVHNAQSFDEAMLIAKDIETTQFWDVQTVYEEIKHIPHGKKGFVKLKTKESDEQEQAEKSAADHKEQIEAKEIKAQIKKIMTKDKKTEAKSKIKNNINKKQKKIKK